VLRPNHLTAKERAPDIQAYVAGWTAGQIWPLWRQIATIATAKFDQRYLGILARSQGTTPATLSWLPVRKQARQSNLAQVLIGPEDYKSLRLPNFKTIDTWRR